MNLKVIAYARNGHTDKFGIPRQSRDESPIVTRIVFEPEYSVAEALRGIEGYSHLWLIWGFSEATRSRDRVATAEEAAESGDDWSPTVRPPRLGGNRRMGVFATRSPFRPNPIGLSSVRLIEVRRTDVRCTKDVQGGEGTKDFQVELLVSGADLMDGTPVYDIKPYLSFSDSHPEAVNGFAEETKDYSLKVEFQNSIKPGKKTDLTSTCPAPEILRDIEYILSQDPRPAYQDDPTREYKMDYAGFRVAFTVTDGSVIIKKIEEI